MGVPLAEAPGRIVELLRLMQTGLFAGARKFRDANVFEVISYDEFRQKLEEPGGFLLAHWDGTPETEKAIKDETKVTVRCLPLSGDGPAPAPGKCVKTGKPSARRVLFAKAY